MAERISKRRLESRPVLRAAMRGLRAFGRSDLGGWVGEHLYRQKSERIAAELVRIAGVKSVYLLGSTRKRARLGYSDVDLLLVTELDGATHELELRRELVRTLSRANRPLELFLHVDYVERRDLDLLGRLGNAWSLGIDRRAELLTGVEYRRSKSRPDGYHARVAALAESLGHWVNQSTLLVEHPSPRDPFGLWRIAERLLRGVLAGSSGADAETPLATLLEDAAPRLTSLAAHRLVRTRVLDFRSESALTDLVTTTLEALDRHAQAFAPELGGAWPSSVGLSRVDWPESRAVGSSALHLGFADAEAAPRGVSGAKHMLFVTTEDGTEVEDAVRRHRALLGRASPLPTSLFGKATWPVLLTPAMRRAASLIEPFPLLGAALSSGSAWTARGALPAVPALGHDALEAATTMALVQLLWRPRGRALRLSRARGDTLEGMARDIYGTAPQLLAAANSQPLDFSPPRIDLSRLDERALLEALGELLACVRPRLQAMLEST